MIIECHHCKARVDGEEVGRVEEEMPFWSKRTYLLRCPVCQTALVGECEDIFTETGTQWSQLVRVHPEPGRAVTLPQDSSIPKVVLESLKEAEKCLQVGAHLAAAAMAGRAVEGICRHFSTRGSYLASGLQQLKDQGIIDLWLYEWGEALREERNKASHAEDTDLSAKDAEDILFFTYAIVDYVFLIRKRFEAFKNRKPSAVPLPK